MFILGHYWIVDALMLHRGLCVPGAGYTVRELKSLNISSLLSLLLEALQKLSDFISVGEIHFISFLFGFISPLHHCSKPMLTCNRYVTYAVNTMQHFKM